MSDKVIQQLRAKGYTGTDKQVMDQFIRSKIQQGGYTEVFSSYVHTPDPEPTKEIGTPVQLPWYKRLFS